MNQPSNNKKILGEKCHTLILVLKNLNQGAGCQPVRVEKQGGQKEEEEGRRSLFSIVPSTRVDTILILRLLIKYSRD